MAKDVRYYVNACIEIYVPDQGYGEKSLNNENKDENPSAALGKAIGVTAKS